MTVNSEINRLAVIRDSTARSYNEMSLSVEETRKRNNVTIQTAEKIKARERVEQNMKALTDALEKIADEHMERTGYEQSDCDMVPTHTQAEMQRIAREALMSVLL